MVDNPGCPKPKEYTFDRTVRLVIASVITVCALLLVKKLSAVLLPFFGAWLIAYILEPVVQLNMRLFRSRRRLLPVICTLLEILVVIVGLCFLLAPMISREAQQLDAIIHAYADNPETGSMLPVAVQRFLAEHIDVEAMAHQMSGQDWTSLMGSVMSVVATGFSLITSFLGWFLMALYLFFIMLDYDRMYEGLLRLIPKKAKADALRVLYYMKHSIGHYFRGQSLIAFTVGVLFSIGFVIIGLPLAIVFGLFIGLLNMVPYLQLLSIPIATLLCLMHTADMGEPFWPYWWECMLVYCVVQSLQDLVITPRIMGKAMNLNPAIIFLSLSIWGALLGFVGLVIALPLTAMLIALYKVYILHTRSDIDPLPATEDAEGADSGQSSKNDKNEQQQQ